jgi:hypothetical protein
VGGFSGITETRVSVRARREALTPRSPSLTFAHQAHLLERRVVVSAKVSSGQKCLHRARPALDLEEFRLIRASGRFERARTNSDLERYAGYPGIGEPF